MLTFESPFYEYEDVVIFRDHASPSLFYYLAGPPHLTRGADGKPHLLMLKYIKALEATTSATAAMARDQLGGAFLMLGVDCGLSPTMKSSITTHLQNVAPAGSEPVSLVPVLYTKGTVSIILLDSQKTAVDTPPADAQHSDFVRGIVGSSTPSLLGDQRAIFSISLSPDAATLIEKAFDSELSPIGVMYELEFAGLRPALQVKAHVDKKRLYEQFKVGLQIGFHSGGGTAADTSGGSTTGGGGGQATGGAGTTTPRTPTPGAPAQPAAPAPAAPAPGPAAPAPAPAAPVPAPAQPAAAPQPVAAAQPAAAAQPGGSTTQPGKTTTQPGAASSGTQVAVDADLSYMMEKAKESGSITIEIIEQQSGASIAAMEQRALDLLKESLLNEFFKPAMTAAPSPATALPGALNQANAMMGTAANTSQGTAGTTGSKVQIGFQLQYKTQEELKEADFNYSVISPETRTHSPNGFFSALVGRSEINTYIKAIDLDDAFFKVIDVGVSTVADFAALDLKAIVTELQYGGTPESPRVNGAIKFTPTSSADQRFQATRDMDDFTYRYRVGYVFGQAENVAGQTTQYQTSWRPTTTRSLVVQPTSDISMLHIYVEPGVVDWDLVDRIETTVRYHDDAHHFNPSRTFQLGPSTPRQEWIVRLVDPAIRTYTAQHTWHLKDHSLVNGDEEPHTSAQLFVGDPWVDRLQLMIQPQVDRTNVLRIEVELEYDDPANRLQVRKNVELNGPDFRPTQVSIPIVDRTRRRYKYQVLLIKSNGTTEAHAPIETDELSIVVSEGGVYMDVTVLLIGTLQQAGIDAVEVEVRAEPLDGAQPVTQTLMFMPGAEPKQTQRLLLRADRPRQFEYRTTVFVGSGAPATSDWVTTQQTMLPLQVARLGHG